MNGKDITNERYVHLTCIGKSNIKNKHRAYLWKFKCDCGRECLKPKSNVISGNTKSCGYKDCKYSKALNPSIKKDTDITNKRYGYLTAISKTEVKDTVGHTYLWKFKCDCGRECLKQKSSVTSGDTRSCGHIDCKYRKEINSFGNKDVDITNKKFGHLVCMGKSDVKTKGGIYLWKFRCDCGRECLKPKGGVTSGDTKTCGHKDCEYRKELHASTQRDIDITNERYGHLIVLGKTDKKDNQGNYLWKFRCDCGRECLKRKGGATRGGTKSCGHPDCKYSKALNPSIRKDNDITNKRYGYLTAVCKTEEKDSRGCAYLWKFKCDCGRECLKRKDSVTSGHTRSCGDPKCHYALSKKKGSKISKAIEEEKKWEESLKGRK